MLTREWAEMIKKNRLYFETEGGDPSTLKKDDDTEKSEKERQDMEQQKLDLDIKKSEFQKQQAATGDREADQRDAEKDKAEKEAEQGGAVAGGAPVAGKEETKPNISFKTQGQYYRDSYPQLRNVMISGGDILDDEERHFVALAVQASEGRFDKEFEKFLTKGHAGNVYGKDFSAEDIKLIMKYVEENEIVR